MYACIHSFNTLTLTLTKNVGERGGGRVGAVAIVC